MTQSIVRSEPGVHSSKGASTWQTEMHHYRHQARLTIDSHVAKSGTCVSCGDTWPCARALAAEFLLEL